MKIVLLCCFFFENELVVNNNVKQLLFLTKRCYSNPILSPLLRTDIKSRLDKLDKTRLYGFDTLFAKRFDRV